MSMTRQWLGRTRMSRKGFGRIATHVEDTEMLDVVSKTRETIKCERNITIAINMKRVDIAS